MPRTIALIGTRCYRRGGMGRYLLELAEHLSRQMEVHVFSAYFERLEAPGVIPHPVRPIRKPIPLHNLSFARKAQKAVDQIPFDIVHAQSMAAFRQDVISSSTCYAGLIEAMYRHCDRSRVKRLLRKLNPLYQIERIQHKETNYRRIIAPSQGTRRDLARFYNIPDEKIRYIPHGVDLDEFHPDKREAGRTRIQRETGWGPDARMLLFVGYEIERKGLSHVLDALSLISDARIKGIIVADSPLLSHYRKRVDRTNLREKVHFWGSIDDPDAYSRIMAGADLLILPSYHESWPLVTLEAHASGVPILGSRTHGIEDHLIDGENGFFIERSGDDIAQKILFALDDKTKMERMRHAARRTAERYSWKRMAEQTLELYRELAPSPHWRST
jgi:glycosyltransferase involved in cell wall biosynthesis